MRSDLTQLILNEVRTARPLILFKAFRHDKEIKRLLGVKKLRKSFFYNLADKKYVIRGKGELVVTDEESAKLLLARIKEKLRYDEKQVLP
jgi:hypothetical protein